MNNIRDSQHLLIQTDQKLLQLEKVFSWEKNPVSDMITLANSKSYKLEQVSIPARDMIQIVTVRKHISR